MRGVLVGVLVAGCGFRGPSLDNDAAIDTQPDAIGTGLDAAPPAVCYGRADGSWSPWQVCLGAAPTGDVALPAAIDTSAASLQCLDAQPAGWAAAGQPAACFIVGGTLHVDATTVVSGKRPLVLVAAQRIAISGTLDVASHRGGTSAPGMPADQCGAFARAATDSNQGGGGGAGASFMTSGGEGGDGNFTARGGRPAPADTAAPTVLRGGCKGQKGGGGGGGSGGGGGAVYLLAGDSIEITGAILASGAGATGGNHRSGGSGAGSGGMIALYANTITATTLIANGGGGAGGGGQNSNGSSGHDPTDAHTPADGGNGPGSIGGKGFPALGVTINGTGGGSKSGGGGGGGGAGYIVANQPLGATAISPPAAVVP